MVLGGLQVGVYSAEKKPVLYQELNNTGAGTVFYTCTTPEPGSTAHKSQGPKSVQEWPAFG